VIEAGKNILNHFQKIGANSAAVLAFIKAASGRDV
jgi:hypothetical protein